jgi:hypothetical protein
MSMTERSKARVRVFADRSFFRRLVKLLALLVLGSSGRVLCAQTVGIKLVNGRSGRPMASTCVNVWVGNERKAAMAIPSDENGVARLRLTDKDGEIDMNNRWKGCGDFGVISPVVKYNDSLRINAGYVLCQSRTPDHTWLAIADLSTKEVLQHGIVTPNTCGKATALPEPGEVIIFVRPLSWWEKQKE